MDIDSTYQRYLAMTGNEVAASNLTLAAVHVAAIAKPPEVGDVAKLAKAEYLTVPQAAKLSTLSERTIYRLVDEGKVKGYKSGKAVRVRRLELDRYLAGREKLSG